MAFPMMVPSQPNSANLGNSLKVEIPPEAISFNLDSARFDKSESKILLYNSKLGPYNIPSFEISVQITY